jgi:hypothetical protein
MAKSSGTTNWTRAETDFLLSLLDQFIPLTTPDWEEVKAQFDKKYANKQRTAAALQRQFTNLHRMKEPTGNPGTPSPVLKAQTIKEMMDEKTDGTRGLPSPLVESKPDDEEREEERNNDADSNGILPLSHNAVQELSRLHNQNKQPFFEPILQIIFLQKKPSRELYDICLSDGLYYIMATCAEAVSALADKEYFTLFSLIKVQDFENKNTGADGKKSCHLLRVENTMIPNPGKMIGNPVSVFQSSIPPISNAFFLHASPVPASIEFAEAMRGMCGYSAKKGSVGGGGGGGGGGGKDEFTNIMRLMLVQQQGDRKHWQFMAEQDKRDRDGRARELQLEREERAQQACEDHQQQQQFMNMMWMQMMGGKKKAREDSGDKNSVDDEKTTTPRKKSPRKK